MKSLSWVPSILQAMAGNEHLCAILVMNAEYAFERGANINRHVVDGTVELVLQYFWLVWCVRNLQYRTPTLTTNYLLLGETAV